MPICTQSINITQSKAITPPTATKTPAAPLTRKVPESGSPAAEFVFAVVVAAALLLAAVCVTATSEFEALLMTELSTRPDNDVSDAMTMAPVAVAEFVMLPAKPSIDVAIAMALGMVAVSRASAVWITLPVTEEVLRRMRLRSWETKLEV